MSVCVCEECSTTAATVWLHLNEQSELPVGKCVWRCELFYLQLSGFPLAVLFKLYLHSASCVRLLLATAAIVACVCVFVCVLVWDRAGSGSCRSLFTRLLDYWRQQRYRGLPVWRHLVLEVQDPSKTKAPDLIRQGQQQSVAAPRGQKHLRNEGGQTRVNRGQAPFCCHSGTKKRKEGKKREGTVNAAGDDPGGEHGS